MGSIAEHQAAIAALRAESDEAKKRLRGLRSLSASLMKDAQRLIDQRLTTHLDELSRAEMHHRGGAAAPWLPHRWDDWRPQPADLTTGIRVGHLREQRSGTDLPVSFLLPLIGSRSPIVIRSRGPDEAQAAAALLQSLVMRTAVMFPQRSRYTLIDPGGAGTAFPMTRYLMSVRSSTKDVSRDLDVVLDEINRIVSTYLDARVRFFEEIPDELRLAETYHFVFAADFPNNYDGRAAERLQDIGRTGPTAGVYLIVHHNTDRQPDIEMSRYALEDPHILDVGSLARTMEGLDLEVILDDPPSADLLEMLLKRIATAPLLEKPVRWHDASGLPEEEWWTHRADTIIAAPLGKHGADQELRIWFGEHEREKRPCAHGVLGAMTGAGKSTLFHTLITALAIRYSPEELRFFLIDGKFGVEFQPYRALPHAEVVSLRTSPELARSVLRELQAEMERRNALFTRHGVADFTAYRRGQPAGPLPRLLLLVDEYQQLFDGDGEGEASALLLRLSQQGRSAGIHMLLASQRFDTPGMLHRTDTFGNIHLRMAMQIAEADIAALTDFGVRGRNLIGRTCDRPGRIVINDQAGNDEFNVAGRVSLITPEQRDETIAALRARASGLQPNVLLRRVIFNGRAQPELLDNPHVTLLLQQDSWASPDQLEKLARAPLDEGGLGVSDWLAADQPLPMFLGQEFNVRGHAMAIISRRPGHHLILVGDRHQERVAMLAAACVSVALAATPDRAQFLINDRSASRTPWADVLEHTAGVLQDTGFEVTFDRTEGHAEELIAGAIQEIETRFGLTEDERASRPSLVIVLNEPDRVTPLRRTADDFGLVESPLGSQLQQILAAGADLGVHVIISSSTVGSALTVLSEATIHRGFDHRVAMQMSEDDSFLFVRSSQAAHLQPDGPRPTSGLLFDNQRQLAKRFKPYSIEMSEDAEQPTHGSLLDQISEIGNTLEGRDR